MFDIKKARQDGIDEQSIKIMDHVNANIRRCNNCSGHEFKRVGTYRVLSGHKATVGKYRCKNCHCEQIIDYVRGYYAGLKHANAKDIKMEGNKNG